MSIVKKKIKPKNGSTLSPSKINILRWVQEGKTNEEIGKIIGKTKWTVKFHLKHIMEELDVVNRAHAVSEAIGQGILGQRMLRSFQNNSFGKKLTLSGGVSIFPKDGKTPV